MPNLESKLPAQWFDRVAEERAPRAARHGRPAMGSHRVFRNLLTLPPQGIVLGLLVLIGIPLSFIL